VRRLGFARWKRLHRLVYVAALLGVVHFVWRVKADLRRPIWFAVAVGALLALRAVPLLRRRAISSRRAAARSR
jgi:sulfoxide reductase heme-binding subunit YedZ